MVFLLVLVVLVAALRLARVRGALRTGHHCQICGRSEPSTSVMFFRNTGMVVFFRPERLAAQACRRCSVAAFVRMTGWTLLFGWWGLISFFVNFLFIGVNVLTVVWALTLPSGSSIAKLKLAEQRDYALALLETKDFDTVVTVLVKATGAAPEVIESYLRSLRPDLYQPTT